MLLVLRSATGLRSPVSLLWFLSSSVSLGCVRVHLSDDLILCMSVQFPLGGVDLVLHQVVDPEAQSYVVEEHVEDHFVEVESQVILLHLERL